MHESKRYRVLAIAESLLNYSNFDVNLFQVVIAFTYRRNGALVSCKYRSMTKKFWQVSVSVLHLLLNIFIPGKCKDTMEYIYFLRM